MANDEERIDFSGYVALNTVQHGNEDGTVTVFNPGDSVDELDYDTLVGLLGSQAIGEPPAEVKDLTDENARLQAQIADLQAALLAAGAPANLNAPVGSGAEVMSDADKARADAATAAAQQELATNDGKKVDVAGASENKDNKSTNPPTPGDNKAN